MAKSTALDAMVCGAVKYKPEGEGGQERKKRKKKGEEEEAEWNERGESPRARLRTQRRGARAVQRDVTCAPH